MFKKMFMKIMMYKIFNCVVILVFFPFFTNALIYKGNFDVKNNCFSLSFKGEKIPNSYAYDIISDYGFSLKSNIKYDKDFEFEGKIKYKDPNHDRICKLINDCLVNSAKICDIRRELYDDFEPDPEEFIQNEKLALEKQSKAVEEEMKKDKKVKKIENSMKLNWAKILNLILSIREQ